MLHSSGSSRIAPHFVAMTLWGSRCSNGTVRGKAPCEPRQASKSASLFSKATTSDNRVSC